MVARLDDIPVASVVVLVLVDEDSWKIPAAKLINDSEQEEDGGVGG